MFRHEFYELCDETCPYSDPRFFINWKIRLELTLQFLSSLLVLELSVWAPGMVGGSLDQLPPLVGTGACPALFLTRYGKPSSEAPPSNLLASFRCQFGRCNALVGSMSFPPPPAHQSCCLVWGSVILPHWTGNKLQMQVWLLSLRLRELAAVCVGWKTGVSFWLQKSSYWPLSS